MSDHNVLKRDWWFVIRMAIGLLLMLGATAWLLAGCKAASDVVVEDELSSQWVRRENMCFMVFYMSRSISAVHVPCPKASEQLIREEAPL